MHENERRLIHVWHMTTFFHAFYQGKYMESVTKISICQRKYVKDRYKIGLSLRFQVAR